MGTGGAPPVHTRAAWEIGPGDPSLGCDRRIEIWDDPQEDLNLEPSAPEAVAELAQLRNRARSCGVLQCGWCSPWCLGGSRRFPLQFNPHPT